MNASINYSGFIDLLPVCSSEKYTSADQNGADRAEPVQEANVESGTGQRMAVAVSPVRE